MTWPKLAVFSKGTSGFLSSCSREDVACADKPKRLSLDALRASSSDLTGMPCSAISSDSITLSVLLKEKVYCSDSVGTFADIPAKGFMDVE